MTETTDDLDLVRAVMFVADDLEDRGYPFVGVIRRAARELAELRRQLQAQEQPSERCEWCGAKLVQPERGRRRRFCSDAHRKAAGRKSENAKVAS